MKHPSSATPDLFAWFWNLLVIAGIVLLVRFYFRRLRFSIYTGGWSTLAAGHTMLAKPLEVRWRSSSARVGPITYKNTMNVAVLHGGLYLQRDSWAMPKDILFLRAEELQLVSRHAASWLGNAYCIFTAGGVDVWVEQPYADALLRVQAAQPAQISPS